MDLANLYTQFEKWKEEHPTQYYVIWQESKMHNGRMLRRFQAVQGVELDTFFSEVEIFTIGGKRRINNAIKCSDARKASQLARWMNAQYVYDHERELFDNSPAWQEEYQEAIKNLGKYKNIQNYIKL